MTSQKPPLEAAQRQLLITTSTFPIAADDGQPRFVYDLAEALADHYKITVLAPDHDGAVARERVGRVDAVRFGYFRPRRLQRLAYGGGMPYNLRHSWLARLQVPLYIWAQTTAVRRLANQQRFPVVNAHWLVPQGLCAARARGAEPRFRLVVHVHSGDVRLLHRLPWGRAVARFVMRRSDAVFVTSNDVLAQLDDLVGRSTGAAIRSMGVECERFARPAQRPESETGLASTMRRRFPEGYLLFVGRLVEFKGAVYLIRALPRILERYPRLGLVVVGEGPERKRIEAAIDHLELAASVAMLGRLPHPDVIELLHGCSVSVIPSIVTDRGETEGMPTVVVEAMAAGTRLVATKVDGIPDVVQDGDNGWLCRQQDPTDLAEKILRALAEPADSPVVRAAVATATDYDWRAVARSYRETIDRLIDGGSQ